MRDNPMNEPEREDRLKKGYIDFEGQALKYPEINLGLDALLSAQVVGAWTAFEVLSGDLWIAAVNAAPAAAVRWAQKDSDKAVPLSKLVKYGDHSFNLGAIMGDVLAAEEKVSFLTLTSTRIAYEKAFDRAPSAFNDPQLKLLELVRNLIVHNGGKVDQTFKDQLRQCNLERHADCVDVQLGLPYVIDGPLAARFTDAASKGGASLIKFVSNTLWPPGHD